MNARKALIILKIFKIFKSLFSSSFCKKNMNFFLVFFFPTSALPPLTTAVVSPPADRWRCRRREQFKNLLQNDITEEEKENKKSGKKWEIRVCLN